MYLKQAKIEPLGNPPKNEIPRNWITQRCIPEDHDTRRGFSVEKRDIQYINYPPRVFRRGLQGVLRAFVFKHSVNIKARNTREDS